MNEELRAKLNGPPTLSQEELDALAKAKEKAMSISCANNLKQFGLALHNYHDRFNLFPPGWQGTGSDGVPWAGHFINYDNLYKCLSLVSKTQNLVASHWTYALAYG